MRALNVMWLVIAACTLAGCSGDASAPALAHRSRTGNGDTSAAGMGAGPLIVATPMTMTSPSSGPTVVPQSEQPSATKTEGPCGALTQTAQNMLQPVDVIFSIDTSGSMRDEIAFVKENMNAFSQQIRAAGVDVHVVVIGDQHSGMQDPFGGLLFTDGLCIAAPLGSGTCPDDSNPPTYAHVIDVIGQWNILDAYITHYPEYKQYLRERSLKTFVSVSDADASTSADKFMSDVMALDPSSQMWKQWRYSAIYPFMNCGDDGQAGLVHSELVMQTQGVAGDLCQQDFAPVFDAIAKKLVDVAQLSCDWAIPTPPSMERFDRTKTNVQLTIQGQSETLLKSPTAADCGDREGWHYDDESTPTRVVACPATCSRIQAAQSAQVDVLFGCETQVAPS